jgi:hypothetical protein
MNTKHDAFEECWLVVVGKETESPMQVQGIIAENSVSTRMNVVSSCHAK